MDAAVVNALNRGNGLYAVNEELLVQLNPTHIITQDLCNVCPLRVTLRPQGTLPPLFPLDCSPRAPQTNVDQVYTEEEDGMDKDEAAAEKDENVGGEDSEMHLCSSSSAPHKHDRVKCPGSPLLWSNL